MGPREHGRFDRGRRVHLRVGPAILALGLLGGCTGENLFTGVALIRDLIGPEVEITAPQSGLTVAEGDSVLVTATLSSSRGVAEVSYAGVLDTGGSAFNPVVVPLAGPRDTTVSRYLRRTGTTAGGARIIVEATDVTGETGADTVSVQLGG
ncbi:MAG TPA: Ig-like domain-containing protein [Longimicrobiales bacterium]|nr:Ig-like domain-containing protein [Longimicrobiales bacterium]